MSFITSWAWRVCVFTRQAMMPVMPSDGFNRSLTMLTVCTSLSRPCKPRTWASTGTKTSVTAVRALTVSKP